MASVAVESMIRDGFPGQRMLVLPRPRVSQALSSPGIRKLIVTDCGFFPHAQSHGRSRPIPIRQLVVLVCARGEGWCETAGGRYPVKAGQVVIIPPGEPHSYGADDRDPWTLWWLHLDGEDVADFLRAATVSESTPVRTVSDLYGVIALIGEVIQWMERDSTDTSLLRASGAAWHLLAGLASARVSTANDSDSLVDSAARYLREHVYHRISVTELANMAGLSASHFSALFKRYVGIPVMQYQTQLRMASARELLDTTNRSVEQIAEAVGYEDSFYFARQFRKIHGTSPSVYRRHDKG